MRLKKKCLTCKFWWLWTLNLNSRNLCIEEFGREFTASLPPPPFQFLWYKMLFLMYGRSLFQGYILYFNWKLVLFPLHLLNKSWTKIWSRDPLYKVKGIEYLYNNTVLRVWQAILIYKFYLPYLPIFFKSLEKFLYDPLLTVLLLYNSEISVPKNCFPFFIKTHCN